MLFKSNNSILVSLLFLSLPVTSFGAGDVDAGKLKSATCAACHGIEGISIAPTFPNLAGQVPGYISEQLAAFKNNERASATSVTMAPFLLALTEQDMDDLDAYYASLNPADTAATGELQAAALEGQTIYRGGVAEREIAACMGCHGPDGHGIPALYPRVSAQHQAYLEEQLLAFKKGERVGYNNIMSEITFSLSEQQITALAAYMAGLN